MNKREFEILDVKADIIEDNDKEAERLRNYLESKKVFMVNLMASPGAGKTTVLVRTINTLKDKYRIGVMEADVDSDVDAEAVKNAGAKVIQLHTGGSCHMDADMTRRGIEKLGIEDRDVIFLENIGNLVCPAEFDVGAAKKVAMLSVPEGDDKPLKYPLMFQVCDFLMISKLDVRPVFDFDIEACKRYVAELNKECPVVALSSKTGENFESWIDWLTNEIERFKKGEN